MSCASSLVLFIENMPGKKRKATAKVSSARKKRMLTVKEVPQPPQKYRQWSEESMVGALKAVSQGMGINRAALEFGIPKTTLKDRVAGRVQYGCKAGRAPYLTFDEEEELVEYLKTCAKIGYPKRCDDVIGIVRRTLQNKAGGPVEDFKGNGWWLRFMQRWPTLTHRKGDSLAQCRADAVKTTNLNQYYSLLEETLKKHGLLNSPNQIYNMDESGFTA